MSSPVTNSDLQNKDWQDLGPVEIFQRSSLREANLANTKVAVSYKDGQLGVVSGVCNHVGGPLGQGRLDGDFIVCPWHNWKFHRITGEGEPGFEDDQVPRYEFKTENGRLWVRIQPAVPRHKKPHDRHPLARLVVREAGP